MLPEQDSEYQTAGEGCENDHTHRELFEPISVKVEHDAVPDGLQQ